MHTLTAPNIASSAFKANPYPFYARLREEAPVFPVKLPDKQTAYLITRYDDVVSVLKDERFVKNPLNAMTAEQNKKRQWVPGFMRPLTRNMLDLDGDDHARLRALVHKAFTPRRIEELRQRIQQLCDDLLDTAQHRGKLELVGDYALPIPLTIISEMLGVPPAERMKFRRWSNRLVSLTSAKDLLTALPVLWLFMRYVRSIIAKRRTAPEDDLITALVQAEEAGDRLSEDELLAMIFLLIIAGHETTVNLIASGALALLQHPDQCERLKRNPELIKPAIEELLRFTSPVEMATERFTREEVVVAGTTIPPRSLVLAVLGSANRDEQHFLDPDTLDIAREPNRHLAFGQGVHYCLGAPLARLEGQIAVSTLFNRYANLGLATPPATLRWRKGLVLRGLEQLPLAY